MRNLLIATCCLILYSCANVQAPTGGPVDVEPPEVIFTAPETNTTNYTSQEIRIEFNERIGIRQLRQNLLITPYTNIPYEARVSRGNILILTFEEPLKENTTYTLNFQNAVTDITEMNPVQDVRIAFSTGPVIDSLTLSGTVRNLMTGRPAREIPVLLFDANDTSDIISEGSPAYLANTQADGQFSFTNLKEGYYHLYALKDANQNLTYNANEAIAFKRNLYLDTSIQNLELYLARIDTTAPDVLRQSQYEDTYQIEFTEGVATIDVEPINRDIDIPQKLSQDGTTLTLYNPFGSEDSVSISMNLTDSLSNKSLIETQIYFNTPQFADKQGITYNVIPENRILAANNPEIQVIFNDPVKEYNSEGISFIKDTTVVPATASWNEFNTVLTITDIPSVRDSLELSIEENTFTSIYNNQNEDTLYIFLRPESEDFGTIGGTITAEDGERVIVQLIDPSGQVIRQIREKGQYTFENVTPGTYRMRVILDKNNNGIWDQGNILENKQPEPVIFYEGELQVRANWEIADININLR